MRWLTIGVGLAALAGASALGAACSPESSDTQEQVDPSLADVVFEGDATPRALQSLLDATPFTDVTLGPAVVEPPNNSELKASMPVVFEWKKDGTTALRTAPRPTKSSAAPHDTPFAQPPASTAALGPTLLPASPAPSRGLLPGWLKDLAGPERSASAAPLGMHEKGYFLLFSTDSTPRLLRVFTTKTTYTPDAAAWKKLSSVGTWTQLIIASAGFWDDAVQPGTGPYVGAPVLFCITPD